MSRLTIASFIAALSFILPLNVSAESSSVSSYQAAEKALQQELVTAQAHYKSQVKKIEKQRAPQLKKVRAIEAKLLALRSELAADVRSNDEQYLSLKQIQSRLTQWEDQNRFIHNQLSSVVHVAAKDASEITVLFEQRLTDMNSKLSPVWKADSAVKQSGEVIAGKSLSVGPLSWFNDNGALYLTERSDNTTRLKVAIDAVNEIDTDNKVSDRLFVWQTLPTDITAGKATIIASESVSYWQKLQVGGIWSYPILGFGALSLLMSLIKFFQLIRLPKIDAQFALQCIEKPTEKMMSVSSSWQQQIAAIAWQSRSNSIEETGDHLLRQLMLFKSTLERSMSLLAATAAVAPLLGLLGTVSGMIHTFEMMNLFGNKDQSLLSGGISEALFTTELGLIVAIPALLSHAYLSRKHQSYLTQLESDAVLLTHLGKDTQAEAA